MESGIDPGINCLARTCNKQYNNCTKANPQSPGSNNSPKGEGGPGAKQNDAKPKKGIDGAPSGTWVPNSSKKSIDGTQPPLKWVPNSSAKGKGVPSVPAGGTWNPSPGSGGNAQNLRSGGRR